MQPLSIVQEGGGKEDFFNLGPSELEALLEEHIGEPKYRATQLIQWVYGRGIKDLSLMTDLGKNLRGKLSSVFSFPRASINDRHISTDGTRKYLFGLNQGDAVESVMIKQPTRMTLCVSSQVGCGMGCEFCRTATMGFRRNLSTSEIIQQVLAVLEDAKSFGDTFQNMVFMGMGEPLHNVNNVIRALEILTHPHGLSIAPRKITVSTVGLIPGIKKFGEANAKANLAVSLNATTDEVRTRIMPINKRYPIADLLGTLRDFPLKGRKKITFEYVMLSEVNDKDEDLKRLPKLLKGIPSKINLIPYNDNAGLGFRTPPIERIHKWQRALSAQDIDATIRWSKGQDISAACGQLAVKDLTC